MIDEDYVERIIRQSMHITPTYWDGERDVVLEVRVAESADELQPVALFHALSMGLQSDAAMAMSPRAQQIEESAKDLWDAASSNAGMLALQWWNRMQNVDQDEVAWRREEKEAQEAERAAAKEEAEAVAAEEEAELQEEAAWLAEERMRYIWTPLL